MNLLTLHALAAALTLTSPDGSQRIDIRPERNADSVLTVSYDVTFRGNPVVQGGRMGLDLDNRSWEMALALGKRRLPQPAHWMDTFVLDSITYQSADTVWHPLYGERSTVRDRWNGGTLHMSRHDGSDYRLDIQARAYDEGIAFRYFFPEHPAAVFHKVTDDLTTYRLPEGTMRARPHARISRRLLGSAHRCRCRRLVPHAFRQPRRQHARLRDVFPRRYRHILRHTVESDNGGRHTRKTA